jgi:hypothetical protein
VTKCNRSLSTYLLLLLAPVLISLIALAPSAVAQEVRASITGLVTDSSGAAVAGAQVTATRTDRNVAIETRTNEGGNYTTPFLDPGIYRVTVQLPGFKQYVRERVELQTQDRARLDVTLEVGDIAESVSVTDSISQLETETASRSQVISNKLIEQVPTQGRNPFQLAWAAGGVIKTGDWRYLRSFDVGGTSNFSVNGGVNRENEILVDGISNVRPNRSVVHVPTMETVQEFKVLTNTYDAQYGRTGGGTVSITTKGGGNQFHGALFHYFQAEELNANQSELNRGGVAKPPMTINVYGFQTSGPVFIPKVFDGRNKLFWTLSYEAMRQRSADPGVRTFPLDEWRGGDFGTLRNTAGNLVSIYDPLTTNSSGNRQTFANNRIPSNRIHPIAANVMALYPSPNAPGDTAARINNYIFPSRWVANMDQWSGRMDYAINDGNRVFFRYAQNPFEEFRGLVWNGSNVAEPTGNAPLIRNGRNWAAEWTSTLSPTTYLNVRAGLSRWETSSGNSFGAGFNPATLGFSQDLVGQFSRFQFPRFNLGQYQAIGSDSIFSSSPDDTYSLQPSLNMVRGAHFLKFGTEIRRFNSNTDNPGQASGNYTFTRNWTQARALQADAASGNELATFLLGHPTSGFADLNISPAYRSHYYALFLNDDWKVNTRLTVNLGFRWDYESPMIERYDRQARGFNFNQESPINGQAAGIDLRGVVQFAGVGGNPRTAFNADRNNFQPRVGAAYRLNNKTVLRGGYGLYYLGQAEFGSALGFSQRSNVVASEDGNFTPAVSLANPFANLPNGQLLQPVGNSRGDASFLGQSITANFLDRTLPYSHQFSFDIQRELGWDMLFEIGYTGNQTRGLPVNVGNLNVIPTAELGRRRPDGAIDTAFYNQLIANPMAGLIPDNAALNNTSIARQRLLVPFPHFNGVALQNVPIGRQSHHGMQLKLTKRCAQGFSFIANYGIGKTLEQRTLLNNQDFNLASPQDSNLEKRSATQIDIPQRFVITGVWEFPFGRGKAIGAGWGRGLDILLGGWALNANATLSQGWAVDYPNANQLRPGSAALSGSQTETMTAFDTSLWQGVPQLEPFTLRQFPSRFGDVRTPGYRNIDASLSKNIPITESVRAQFRFEMINATNTPWFPRIQSLDVQNPQFGRLDPVQRNLPRWIKLGLVLNW